MGKTQDKFIEEQERLINKAVDAFADDDYQYQEYLKSLTPPSKPVTMEEANKEWDDWWNSLTNADKEQLYKEQLDAEEYFKNNPSI
jgi:hypothetical protein|tara:strand:- start:383 stop:640 length:258 start_codon:yes stop_codon:yes gene_type:complete